MSSLSKIIALLFLVLTIISTYYFVSAKIALSAFVSQYGSAQHPLALELLTWEYKTQMLFVLTMCLDVVVFAVYLNLYYADLKAYWNKKKSKSFSQLPMSQQDEVLSEVYCKSCLSKQSMIFEKELYTQGIKRYQLICKKCGGVVKVRKN